MLKNAISPFIAIALLTLPGIGFAKTITVTVNGMVCDFCAQGIHKNMGAEPGVKSVEVSLEKHYVKIETKDNIDISDDTITKDIEKAGDAVAKIERE